MEIITRKIIHKGLIATSLKLDANYNVIKEITSYDDVILKIDAIKEFLITSYNVLPGQKVVLLTFYWPDYLSWLIACSELGLILVVIDYPRTKEALKKFDVYGKLDYLIYDLHYPPGFIDYDITLINANQLNDFKYSGNSTPVWVTPDSILMYSTSSGTTGAPKLLVNRHNYFWDLMHRNAQAVYNLKDSDKCFHSKILHHGSVSATYFFPTLRYCKYHYHAPYHIFVGSEQDHEEKLIKAWVNMIQEEQITRCTMFYDQIDYLIKYLDLSKKQHDNLNVYVIAKIKPEHIDVIVKQFSYTLSSNFGTTQTGGPVFLPEINMDNCNDFNLYNMGELPDEFYKLRLTDESLLEIKTPWDEEYICTGDKFEVVNNQWIHKGRENIYKINGRTLYIIILIEIIESKLNLKNEEDFDIIVDQQCDKIYIRSNMPINLDSLNEQILDYINEKEYKIYYNLVISRARCFSGIKFDPEYIRIVCRNAIGLN